MPSEIPITNEFEENVVKFELQKNRDLKQMLLDFTRIQLKHHAKSLEILSAVYQDVAAIDEEADIEEFKSKFMPEESQMLKPQMRSQSMGALTTIAQPSNGGNKRNLSSSTYSLDSPNHGSHPIEPKGKMSPSRSVDLERIDSVSEDFSQTETEEGEDEISASSLSIDQVRPVKKFMQTDDEEDDDVIVQPNGKSKKKNNAFAEKSVDQKGKSPKPLPRPRLSKSLYQ